MRLRALQARGPSGSGIRPGAKRPHVIRHYRLRATTSVNAGTAPSDGSATSQAVQRRAERRKAPRPLRQGQGGAHVGGDAPHGVLGTGRHSALRPLGFAEGTKTRRPGGKHDGQPRGRATPRTISHGWMTLWIGRERARFAVTHGARPHSAVMPGLVPGIHVFLSCAKQDVDGRTKSGHDVAGSNGNAGTACGSPV